MKINAFKDVDIVKRKNGTFEIFYNDEHRIRRNTEISAELYSIMKECRNGKYKEEFARAVIIELKKYGIELELSGDLSKKRKE